MERDEEFDLLCNQLALDAEDDAGLSLEDMDWQLKHNLHLEQLRRIMVENKALVYLILEACVIRARDAIDQEALNAY
jgi:hypothetical protein